MRHRRAVCGQLFRAIRIVRPASLAAMLSQSTCCHSLAVGTWKTLGRTSVLAQLQLCTGCTPYLRKGEAVSNSSEVEIGLRDARTSLGQLVDKVVHERFTVFLTKHGHRIAIIKKFDDTTDNENQSSAKEVASLTIPGNVEAAIALVDPMLADIEGHDANSNQIQGVGISDLIGGLATLIYYLIPASDIIAEIENEEERRGVEETIARLPLVVSRRLLNGGIDITVIPTIAGAISAAICGLHPSEWRNKLPGKIGESEFSAWLYGCWGLADLINQLMGEGVAENVLYTITENLDELESERNGVRL